MALDIIFGAQNRAQPVACPGKSSGLLAAAFLLAAIPCPEAAWAVPESGPTASASLNISVSVAKRYSLGAAGAAKPQQLKQPDTGQFCISTNGGEMLLPVMLIWTTPDQANESRQPEAERAMLLPPCGASGRMPSAADAPDQAAGMRAVIVRPE